MMMHQQHQQQGGGVPLGMPALGPYDPNYHYWYNNYSWWFFSGADHGTIYHAAVDAKLTRVAYGLAGQLVLDRIKKEEKERLASMKMKVFDFALTEGDVSGLMESLGIKVETVKQQDIAFHVVSHKLQPNQVVVINALHTPQSKEITDAFATFVSEGGRLLFFNAATQLVAAIFPNKIAPAPPSTTITSKLRILAEKELFEGAYRGGEQIDLEYYRYPVEIIDKKAVKVYAQTQARILEPLFMSWESGHGIAYMFVSKMFLRKKRKEDEESDNAALKRQKEKKMKLEQEKKAQEQTQQEIGEKSEKMEVEGTKAEATTEQPQKSDSNGQQVNKKRRKTFEPPPDFDDYLTSRGASKYTRTAWEFAVKVGYMDAYSLAKRALPSLEMMARLISREQAILEDMFETTTTNPGDETQLQEGQTNQQQEETQQPE